MREFVDANVLVYAFDASAGRKKSVADQLLRRLWEDGHGCLSVQVLQEFFVSVTRKVAVPLSPQDASARIRELARWRVFAPATEDVLSAIELQLEAHLSFWDAMLVHAASELSAEVLWTEDLNDGQVISGVRIRNPFTTS